MWIRWAAVGCEAGVGQGGEMKKHEVGDEFTIRADVRCRVYATKQETIDEALLRWAEQMSRTVPDFAGYMWDQTQDNGEI
jgi:hypothetical protein